MSHSNAGVRPSRAQCSHVCTYRTDDKLFCNAIIYIDVKVLFKIFNFLNCMGQYQYYNAHNNE